MSDMVRTTSEKRDRPHRVELANHYYKDAADFLKKYQLAWRSSEMDFHGIKSRRMKAYIDLLMSTETLLKAIVCLRSSYTLSGKALVRRARAFNHGISSLAEEAFANIKIKDHDQIVALLRRCDKAPVSFRYDFDAATAREHDERVYYDTVGNDAWLAELEDFVSKGVVRLGRVLQRRSKLVDARALSWELLHRR